MANFKKSLPSIIKSAFRKYRGKVDDSSRHKPCGQSKEPHSPPNCKSQQPTQPDVHIVSGTSCGDRQVQIDKVQTQKVIKNETSASAPTKLQEKVEHKKQTCYSGDKSAAVSHDWDHRAHDDTTISSALTKMNADVDHEVKMNQHQLEEARLEDITDIDAMFEAMEVPELELSLEEEVQIPSNLSPDDQKIVIREKLLNQQEKISLLQSKVSWMEVKQQDKERRIQEMQNRKLTLKEKLHLRALRKSLVRLEGKIKICNKLIATRSRTVAQLRSRVDQDQHTTAHHTISNEVSPLGPPRTCWVETAPDHKDTERLPEMSEDDISVVHCPTIFPDMDELRAQLKHTSEELEEIRSKRSGRRGNIPKEEKTKKVDVSALHHLRKNETEKVSELNEKLRWMEEKQSGKLRRIQCLKQKKANFNLEEKLKYKALKKSSKKLEELISKMREKIAVRQDTIEKTAELINKYTMADNPTSLSLIDAELDGVQVIRVASDHSPQHTQSGESHSSHPKEAKIADVLKVMEIDRQLQREKL